MTTVLETDVVESVLSPDFWSGEADSAYEW